MGGVGVTFCSLLLIGFIVRSRWPFLSAFLLLLMVFFALRDRRAIVSLIFATAPFQFLLVRQASLSLVDCFCVLLLFLISLSFLRGTALNGIFHRPRRAVAVPAILFLGLSLVSGVPPGIELAQTLRGDSVSETLLSLAMATFSGGNNPLSLSWHHLIAAVLLFLVAGRSPRAIAAVWLQKTAILTTAFLGLVTVAEWILETRIGYPAISDLIGAKFPPGRPPGTFSWPTQLATYLNLTLPLTLAWVWFGRWAETRGTWADRVAPLAGLLGTIALLLSGSRGGWAGLLLSVLLLFILVARSGLSRRRLIFGAVLAVLVYVPLTGLMIGARHQGGKPGSEAATRGAVTQEAMSFEGSGPNRGRLGYTWPAALAMIRAHPILGIGLGTWREVSPDFAPPAARDLVLEKATERAHAHSILLHTAAERGIPAAVALLGLLIVLTVLLFRRASSGGRAATAWLGLAAALPGFLVHGMLDEVMYLPQLFFCFWTLAGLIGSRCEQRGAWHQK